MYGDGRSETLVGEAIAGQRDAVFLVSKVYPHNASLRAMPAACAASLKRLKTDRLDLYLLHWPGAVPLGETVEAFASLQRSGKIRHWGVSNFDTETMRQLWSAPGGTSAQVNQVLYNLSRRGIQMDRAPRATVDVALFNRAGDLALRLGHDQAAPHLGRRRRRHLGVL